MTLEDEADDFIGVLRFERAMSENTCAAYARELAWLIRGASRAR